MALSNEQLQHLLEAIKEQRSNEANFKNLSAKLDDAISNSADDAGLHAALVEAKEKQAKAYTDALAQGSTAWPEYEAFAAQFERSLIAALKQ